MSPTRVAAEALEARLAARLADALTAGQPPLAADVGERLRFARQKALERAQAARRAAPQPRPAAAAVWGLRTAVAGAPGIGGLGEAASWWRRAAAVLPLALLVGGLLLIDDWAAQERIATTADIDLALLADDLPPEAYADPGFVEFLRSEPAEPAP